LSFPGILQDERKKNAGLLPDKRDALMNRYQKIEEENPRIAEMKS
jgi:hypothetical protein